MEQDEADFPVKERFPDDEEDGNNDGNVLSERGERAPSQVGGEDNDDDESGEDIMKKNGNLVGTDDEDDSSEEEDDDPEEAKRIADGFIVDEDDEDDGSDREARRRRKRQRRRRKRQEEEDDDDEQLDEDDLALLAENTGIRRKQRQLKRFRRASASPDADEGAAGEGGKKNEPKSARDLQHMFDDDENDEPVASRRAGRRGDDDDDSDDDDGLPSVGDALRANAGRRNARDVAPINFEDEMEDFIDDDEDSDMDDAMSEGEREARREEKRKQRKAELEERRKRSDRFGFDPTRAGIDAEAWAELNEVFGDSHLYDQYLDVSEDEPETQEAGAEGEERRRAGKQQKGVTRIEDVFEPSAIQERMMTTEDMRIKRSDFPERFLQMLPGDEGETLLERILTSEELDECARWVSTRFSYRSNKVFLSETGEHSNYREQWHKCVRTMVELIINERREAMYLCVHRTDDYELRVGDEIIDLLNRRDFSSLVSACLKFKTLLARRDTLRDTFKDISSDDQAAVSDEDRYTFEQLVKQADSTDEVNDVADWLVMRFGQRMRDAQANRDSTFKRPTVIGRYEQLRSTTVAPFAARFGISSSQFAQNVAGQSRAHFTEDEETTPITLADQYVNPNGGPPSAYAAVDSARTLLAYEIGRDPTIKREARKLFRERGTISVKPTDRGSYKIDDEHPYYNFKYLERKPVQDFNVVWPHEKLPAPAQYLMILRAQEELLVDVTVGLRETDAKAFETRLQDNYLSEGLSETSRLWNDERKKIIQLALQEHLYPAAKLWVQEWLREECWEFVGRACEVALTKRIDCQPYQSSAMKARKQLKQRQIAQPYGRDYADSDDEDDEQKDTNESLPKVLAVSNGKGDPRRDEIETVFVDAGGRVREHIAFETIDKPAEDPADPAASGDADQQQQRSNRPDPSREFKQLIRERRPDVIVVGGFSPRTVHLRQQIQALVQEVINENVDKSKDTLSEEQKTAMAIDVIHSYDDTARMFQHSERAKEEHPSLSSLARYCIGLARYVQSPVQQFAALNDEDLLAIRHDAYQHLIPRERLLMFLERALVAIVNTVCVDINRCLLDASYAHMLRYVSGLGPRKADALVRAIGTQLGGSVVNRDALLMGANDSEMLDKGQEFILPQRVWHNACSFLVIRPRREPKSARRVRMQGRPDALDGTRIHPEAYEYARFIAFDALRKTEEDRLPDQHPSQWCEELMRDDERRTKVEDIDMADYERNLWAEMARQNQRRERKLSMLEFIALELVEPLHEQRRPFALPNSDEVLTMLTGETRSTFDTGCIVTVQVSQIKPDFALVRFESGIEGTIHREYLLPKDSAEYPSQRDVPRAFQLVKHGQTLKASIIDVDMTNLRAELTARPSHLEDAKSSDAERRKVEVDPRYFDRESAAIERDEREQDLRRKQKVSRQTRFINHHLFRNFKAGQAEEFLANSPRGTAIVRPSSKGEDHLAVTWKVDDGVFQHFDVQELDKEPQREVGRILRVTNVGGSSYSDIDELLVNHVVPMARMVEMLMSHEKYHGTEEQLQEYLKQFSLANPNRSQYGFAIDRKRPGLFILGFKANRAAEIQRWYVRVLPGRFKLNEAELPDVVSLCNAFKTQYTTRSMRMAGGGAGAGAGLAGGRTPAPMLAGGVTPALMRTGGGITPSVYRSGPGYGGGEAGMPISATPNPYQYGYSRPNAMRPPPPGAPPVRPGPPPVHPSQQPPSSSYPSAPSSGAAGYGRGPPPAAAAPAGSSSSRAPAGGIHPDRLAQMGAGGALNGNENNAGGGGYGRW